MTHVGTLTTASLETTVTVTLTESQLERLQNDDLSHYYYYSSALDAATNAQIEGADAPTEETPNPVTTNR